MRKLEPTYREALTRSWYFVVHHKIVWILSLCAAIFGQFGLSDFVGQLWLVTNSSATTNWWSPTFWTSLSIPHNGIGLLGAMWLLVILLGLGALVVVLAMCSQAALIIASCNWFKNKTTPKIYSIWNQGVKFFWKLLGINVLQKIILGLLLVILSLFFRSVSLRGGGSMVTTVVVVVGVLFLALVVSSITIYAAGYVVEKKYTFWQALISSWKMFCQHFLVSLELSVLLLFLNIVLVLAVVGSSVLVLIPAVFILIIGGITGSSMVWLLGLLLAVVLLVLVVAILGGIFNAFTTSSWMYLFMKMHTKKVPSRMAHYLGSTIRR